MVVFHNLLYKSVIAYFFRLILQWMFLKIYIQTRMFQKVCLLLFCVSFLAGTIKDGLWLDTKYQKGAVTHITAQ